LNVGPPKQGIIFRYEQTGAKGKPILGFCLDGEQCKELNQYRVGRKDKSSRTTELGGYYVGAMDVQVANRESSQRQSTEKNEKLHLLEKINENSTTRKSQRKNPKETTNLRQIRLEKTSRIGPTTPPRSESGGCVVISDSTGSLKELGNTPRYRDARHGGRDTQRGPWTKLRGRQWVP